MTAVTEDQETLGRWGNKRSVPLNLGALIYLGTLVLTQDSDGYGVAATDAAAHKFVGIASEAKTGGAADGDVEVLVWENGEHLLEVQGGGLTQADIGKAVYVKDNAFVGKQADVSNPIYVGKIVAIDSATMAWVSIQPGAEGPDQGQLRNYTVQVPGTNAAALDFTGVGAASALGGSDIEVSAVLSMAAYVTATGALDKLQAPADYAVAAGNVTPAGDESLNTLVISLAGRLTP